MSGAQKGQIIDPLVNIANEWMNHSSIGKRVREEVFSSVDVARDIPAEEMVSLMDEFSIERAVIGIDPQAPRRWQLEYVEKYPDRFGIALEPRLQRGIESVWALEEALVSIGAVAVRVAPMFVGQPATAPIFYPLYTKCVELDLTVCLTTGIPGPPGLPYDLQHPGNLDRVCLDFPMLRIVMLHGADPWWSLAVRLMSRHKNLFMATSAWSPRHLPDELVAFMNTRGSEKVMFSSDFPMLSFERCISEAQALELRPGILEKYLYSNAERVFFRPREPRSVDAEAFASRLDVSGGAEVTGSRSTKAKKLR